TSSTAESGSGRSTRSRRRRSGRWAKRPSVLSSSSAFSISARSFSALGRYVNPSRVGLTLHKVVVGLLVQQLGVVLDRPQLDDPALAVRILVDILGVVRQFLIDVGDLATDRAVEIGGGLDGFNDAQPASGIELLADRR